MSDSSAAAVAAAGDVAESPPVKRLKSQPPDVVVAVGREEAQVEFECYGTLLCFASEVWDTMLSTNMKEKDTGRIELPDKDSEEWTMFYEFVENSRCAKVGDETRARILLPWFHEFQMTALVAECDDMLHGEVFGRWPDGKEQRKELFQVCQELLSMSYVYDLPRTQERVSEKLDIAIEREYDLFDLDSVKNIIPLLKRNALPIRAIKAFLPDELVNDGHRLLWARIARPVPGVIPPFGPRNRRLGGRLWPCLYYNGGCAEAQKEIDAAHPASTKLKSNLASIRRQELEAAKHDGGLPPPPVLLPLEIDTVEQVVDRPEGAVTATELVAGVPKVLAQDWYANKDALGADGLRGFDSEADGEMCRRRGCDAAGADRAVFDAACARASQIASKDDSLADDSLFDNDLLPFLIHSGMRSKLEIKAAKQERDGAKNALSHVKNELQHVVDNLPMALAVELPEARRMPTPGTEKIDAAAQRWLEKLMYKRWRQQEDYIGFWTNSGNLSSREAVRDMIQIPPAYRHDDN